MELHQDRVSEGARVGTEERSMSSPNYEGTGPSIEAAVKAAHDQIPVRSGRDFTVSTVKNWGMQFGGFAEQTIFYAVVEEDENAPFRT